MRIGIEAQRLLRPHKHGMDIVALELIRALQAIDHDNEYFIFVRPDSDTACLTLQANFTLVQLPGMNYVQWEQVALPRAPPRVARAPAPDRRAALYSQHRSPAHGSSRHLDPARFIVHANASRC